MKIIDLRSDTVTLPTHTMMQAIYNADLGDDIFYEDTTTNRLERMAAERMGKEAALLVVSGTMGNLVSMLTHCKRGEEVILGNQSHIFINEAGGMSAIGGMYPHTVANQPDGTIRLQDIELAIRSENIHYPRTRLICLENTHNNCGGTVLSAQYMDEVATLARKYSLKIHLDGARIFNAAIALGIDVKELTCHADSVSFCLSKGLSGPVGSLICGSKDFIAEARRNRKVIGGGMRQCGIIAAAGIVALEQMVNRLSEDHLNARKLAEGIAQIPYLSIDLDKVQTNIVYFNLISEKINTNALIQKLANHGIKILSSGPNRLRAVTHNGISTEDIDFSLQALQTIIKEI